MTTPSASKTAEPSITDLMYGDLEHELAITRRLLERHPSGHHDWKPHEKSMTLGRLASHVAEIPKYGTMLITTDEADFSKNEYVAPNCETAAELLELFDTKVAELRSVMATVDSAALARPWTLRMGEKVFFTQPKAPLIRQMMINHMVHHRAQLGVYYRMLGVPLPGTYGPSADEAM
jgi:uncharacterized damage-inducible protein DinB